MKEIIIKDMQQLVAQLNEYPLNFIFRGHTDSEWHLESTLERLLKLKWSSVNAKEAEDFSLLEFKSKFHLYDSTNKTPTTKLEWLSIMQHYGVPTRLLDFTESPYIALYFAIEGFIRTSESNFALYAVDYRELIKTSIKYIKTKDSGFKYEYRAALQSQDEIFEDVLNRFAHDILWITNPTQVNLRLDRQSGCFMVSGNIGKRIEDVLRDQIYKNVEIHKIIIPNLFYENIYTLLKKANITGKALYGDLAGLAKSINLALKAYH
ncbi:MAG: hypothetical protein SCALA702_00030 [Melioribacteraceae bacterium]|nr:MAG: hypothetical protein SCALA702_00030 [Melioribacteraceae bacterium]